MKDRTREIFRGPGRTLPFEFLPGLLQMCYLPEIEPSRKVCF
jgi:hypothetical protein